MYAQAQMDVKPKFEVEPVRETYAKRMYTKTEDGLECNVVRCDDASWIVYFPQGHSIRVTDEKEMIRLGFITAPSLIDMNTGEQLTPDRPKSLKELNAERTKQTRSGGRGKVSPDVDEVNDMLGIN